MHDRAYLTDRCFQAEGALKDIESTKEELEKVKADLEVSNAKLAEAQTALDELKAKLEASEVEVAAAKGESAKAQEALATASSALEALRTEMGETTTTMASLTLQVAELGEFKSKADDYQSQVAELNKTVVETVSKLSETEVEVLELRDAKEEAAEQQEKNLATINALEAEIAEAVEKNTAHINELQAGHLEQLNDLKSQMETALKEAQEKAEADRVAAEEQLNVVQADLTNQESKYTAQLEAATAEHQTLLAQAFDKAKVRTYSVTYFGRLTCDFHRTRPAPLTLENLQSCAPIPRQLWNKSGLLMQIRCSSSNRHMQTFLKRLVKHSRNRSHRLRWSSRLPRTTWPNPRLLLPLRTPKLKLNLSKSNDSHKNVRQPNPQLARTAKRTRKLRD